MKTSDVKARIQSDFHNTADLLTREIDVGGISCCLFYLDGLSDRDLFERDIIEPLRRGELFRREKREASEHEPDAGVTFIGPDGTELQGAGKKSAEPAGVSETEIQDSVNFAEDVQKLPYDQAKAKLAEGDIILFVDGGEEFFLFSLRKFERRAVAEPPTSTVLKGPREGFIEEIKTNITLVRRRLKTPNLVFENMGAGRYSSTAVSIVYIDGVADPEVVEEVRNKISAIDIDGIVDSSYISAYLQSHQYSIFRMIGDTEKPDVVAAKLLEGRVAVIVDGSPIVLTVPYMLLEDMQDAYDYYSNDWRSTAARIFRLFGALLTVLLPAAYVALQSYHYHLLPIKFIITLVSATSGIPFPPAVEMLVVLLLFEILNEASLRMPRYLGISLSIVGAIVLGDTAVKAGLISSPAVLVTALSAIGVFCVPDQVGTLSILRLLFLCISAVLGLFGIVVGALVTIAYMATLDSYGTPYLAPYAPRIHPDLQDGILKSGTLNMKRRPFSIPNGNRIRLRKEDLK